MNQQIVEPNAQFPFDDLVLTTPMFVNSGNYFIKFLLKGAPLYIHPPKCVTKQGIAKGGKRMFCDLLFTNENESFIQWLEDLEAYSQKFIFNKREQWFESSLEMHDIENSFTPTMKVYKSGKYYIIRTIVPSRLGKCTMKIFDENEMDVPPEEIKDGTQVVTIWEVLGIKCSTRVFQIDIEIKQMMMVRPDTLFEKCLFSKPQVATLGTPVHVKLPPATPVYVSSPSSVLPPIEGLLEETLSVSVPVFESESVPVPVFESVIESTTEPMGFPSNDEIEIQTDDQEDSVSDEDEDDDEAFVEITEESSPGLDENPTAPESSQLELFEIQVQDDQEAENIQLKSRNDVYYDIYVNAKKKAAEGRDLAISAFLESKHIRGLHRLAPNPSDFTEDS